MLSPPKRTHGAFQYLPSHGRRHLIHTRRTPVLVRPRWQAWNLARSGAALLALCLHRGHHRPVKTHAQAIYQIFVIWCCVRRIASSTVNGWRLSNARLCGQPRASVCLVFLTSLPPRPLSHQTHVSSERHDGRNRAIIPHGNHEYSNRLTGEGNLVSVDGILLAHRPRGRQGPNHRQRSQDIA